MNLVKRFNEKDIEDLFKIFQDHGKNKQDNDILCVWSEPVCYRCPNYILGRYRKLSRDVPQSPWMIGDDRKGRSSIEEIIGEAISIHLGTNIPTKLHGCGREDIDVRCLGEFCM